MSAILSRRITKLEAKCATGGPTGPMVPLELLDPEVLALWLAVDIDQMTLPQLDMLEENIRRLPV